MLFTNFGQAVILNLSMNKEEIFVLFPMWEITSAQTGKTVKFLKRFIPMIKSGSHACVCISEIMKMSSFDRPLERSTWWRHQMETFSALLAICAGNSPVPGEVPAQKPGTRSFDVFFDLRLNKRLSKRSWGWWFETQSHPLWRHCNEGGFHWLITAIHLFQVIGH